MNDTQEHERQRMKDRIRQAGEDRKANLVYYGREDEIFEDGVTDGYLRAFDALFKEATR